MQLLSVDRIQLVYLNFLKMFILIKHYLFYSIRHKKYGRTE